MRVVSGIATPQAPHRSLSIAMIEIVQTSFTVAPLALIIKIEIDAGMDTLRQPLLGQSVPGAQQSMDAGRKGMGTLPW